MSKITLSPSSIKEIRACGWQWYYRKIEGLKPPTNIPKWKGTNFHKIAEVNFRQKIGSRKDLGVADLKDIAASDNLWVPPDEGIIIGGEEPPLKKQIGQAKNEVIALIPLLAKGSEDIQPALVEWMPKNPLCLDAEAEIYLTFRLDLMAENGAIHDHKTSKDAKTQAEVDADLGLTAASFAAKGLGKQIGLIEPTAWYIENYISKTLKAGIKIDYQRLKTKRGEEDYQRLLTAAKSAAHVIKTGNFMSPPEMMAWMCQDCWFRKIPCKGRLY